jgi:hypothetical protein
LKQLALFPLLLITFFHCLGQQAKISYVKQRKINAFSQVFELRQGCLLVMLHTIQNKIDALEKLDRKTEAETFRNQQIKKNENIIAAFKKNFDFCPVYFFFSSDALRLLEFGPDSVSFVNSTLTIDTSIHIKSKKYFVAEFNRIQDDTTGYTTRHHSSSENSETYQTVSASISQAFIIESKNLIQLKAPFPYFVPITETDEKIVFVESVVQKINKDLYKFERKAKKKILNPRFSPYFQKKL